MLGESMNLHAKNNTVPRLSTVVILLTWNQCQRTLRCLRSLVDTDVPQQSIVVWDNGSSDNTAACVAEEFPHVLYHRHPTNLGVASGRNAAVQIAVEELSPEFVLFLDNDMVVTEGLVDRLRAPFADNSQLAQTGAKMLMLKDPRRINAAGGCDVDFIRGTISPVGFGELDHGQFDSPRICLPNGGATMVRVDVFCALEGFDPVFDPYGPEDIDYSLRVRQAGHLGLYVPSAVVYHEHNRTIEGGSFTHAYTANKTRHWMILLRRHASRMQRLGFYVWGGPMGALRVVARELSQGNASAIWGLFSGAWQSMRRAMN